MYKCHICGKINKNIHRHIREVHKLTDYCPPTSKSNFNKCLEGCSASFNTLRDLRSHLEYEHKIKIETEHLQFSTLVEFNTWYDNLCHNENVQYNRHKHVVSSETSITYYNCNRSGNTKELENITRSRKKQGTCKLNYSCTSQIKLVGQKNGYEVTYYKTHYGHSIEIQHIRLSKKERLSVAAKLKSGVTFNRILDDARDNIDGNLKRSDLVSKGDLLNIKKAFGISNNEDEKPRDNSISFEMWIDKQRKSENNCVLFYKERGEKLLEGSINLQEEDFCLIFMNKNQKAMLKKFGEAIVTIENMCTGAYPYDFELTILMVKDEHDEGFPAACMFTNCTDVYIYKVFFSFIKDACGLISPKVFMTDITDVYYNAWIEVMNTPPFRFYCSWHIDSDWKNHLDEIHMLEKRDFVCKTIKYLQTNPDEDAFTRELEKSVDIFIKDPDTSEFGNYFIENYLNKINMWAFCYRKACGINTNMHVESIKRKSVQNLDKCLHAVLNFIRDKSVERIIKLTKEKNNFYLQKISNCHKTAITSNFCIETLNNNEFKVETEEEKCYTVRKQNETNKCCELICQFCQICIHAYKCECTDFLIETTICAHIHVVAMKNINIPNNVNCSTQNPESREEGPVEVNDLECSDEDSLDIEKQKAKTFSMLSFIKTEVDNLSDVLNVSEINGSLKQILSQLHSMKAKVNTEQNLPKTVNTDMVTKNIIKQPSFPITKRKRKTLESTCLKKPNVEEVNDIRAILFQ